MRGNVGTRLDKLDNGQYDAIILACAGLIRLDMADRITTKLDSAVCLPAIGQGAIGIECRQDDRTVNDCIGVLNDDDTRICVTAERAMNHRLEGGCQVPIAGFAEVQGQDLWLRGLVGRVDGSQLVEGERRGARQDADSIGLDLAEELLSRGADVILKEIYANA